MADTCDECGKEEGEYRFYEFELCRRCFDIACENERINARDKVLEDRRLMKGL